MSNKITLLFMLMAAATISHAQTNLPTLTQLTPGHPDYIYPKALLNTVWDQDGKFHYVLPEDTAKAEKVIAYRKPGTPDPETLKKVEEE